MQWLVEVGLSNALAAAVLAIVAWIAGRIWRRPAVTHALWLLVLLKLLTPPIFQLPLPWSISRTASLDPILDAPQRLAAALPSETAPQALERDRVFAAPAGADRNRSANRAVEPPVDPGAPGWVERQRSVAADTRATPLGRSASATVNSNVESTPPQPPQLRGPADSTSPLHPAPWARWGQVAAIVWLVGLIAWIVLQMLLGIRLFAMVRASTPAPVELSDAAAQIARRMGLRGRPQVRIVAGTGSPMLCGLGRRATILVPKALLLRLGPEAQATVLAHELAHYLRGDQWVRLVELVVTGLYWWHPIVWWARQQIEIAEEQCCDAHVIEICAGKSRVYAEALLDIVDLISEPPRRMRPAMSSGIGHRPLLQKRLVDLMRRRCVPKMTPVARRVILVTGAVCLSCHPELFVTEAPTVVAATVNARVPLLAASSGTIAAGANPQKVSIELPNSKNPAKSRSNNPPQLAATHLQPADLSMSQSAEAEEIEWATAISPNGRFHITVRWGYECELREVTSDQVRSLSGHRITCVAFTADSARFVTGDLQGTVRIWDAATGEMLQTLTQREGPVQSVCLAPSGDHAVVAGQDGVVELLSLTSRTDRQVIGRHDAPVRCARFSPDGSRLAVVTDTWRNAVAGTVALYDVPTRTLLRQWEVTGPLGAVDFLAEDRIVTIEWSGRVREWSLPALDAIDLPAIAKELVSAASFSIDSRVLEDLAYHTPDRFNVNPLSR